ncbi:MULTISPECIES: DMT family transporter [Peribacillus]|uniref:DMT family transporter n=1 Tax=Peribacillus TaxID=2675229 RepID=UPI001F4E7E8A|nr:MULTISPECIES: DMT family transporter [unclassified Peribacillus]MCK1983674.1 DMT family transporter [Peribacillus sp. Aquil_B1]MCK2010902.1 DMT family transporter [Peribacillus sp. Aquil_B8]
MLIGLSWAILAGSLVSLQNVFNSKVNEHVNPWSTTTLVLGLGFLASFLSGVAFEGIEIFQLHNMKPWYWFSGLVGIGVVICVTQGVKLLGPTFAISIVMAAQLVFALAWDSTGLLGLEKVPFTFKQLGGILIIIAGMIVFKIGGKRKMAFEMN